MQPACPAAKGPGSRPSCQGRHPSPAADVYSPFFTSSTASRKGPSELVGYCATTSEYCRIASQSPSCQAACAAIGAMFCRNTGTLRAHISRHTENNDSHCASAARHLRRRKCRGSPACGDGPGTVCCRAQGGLSRQTAAWQGPRSACSQLGTPVRTCTCPARPPCAHRCLAGRCPACARRLPARRASAAASHTCSRMRRGAPVRGGGAGGGMQALAGPS
jgi:hypothetical protein